MARNDKKRQKKLEKKRMERKAEASKSAQLKSGGLAVQFAKAASWPIVDALVTQDGFDEGMRTTYLFRRSPDGVYAVASFLVDLDAIGVKDAFGHVVPGDQYGEMREMIEQGPIPVEKVAPAYVRKLVEQSVEFTRSFGLAPHADYDKVKLLFGDIDPTKCTEEFEFGQDGKPIYLVAPMDSESFRLRVSKAVEAAGGIIDYDTRFPGPPGNWDELDDEDLDDEFDEDDIEEEEEEAPQKSNVIEAFFKRRES